MPGQTSGIVVAPVAGKASRGERRQDLEVPLDPEAALDEGKVAGDSPRLRAVRDQGEWAVPPCAIAPEEVELPARVGDDLEIPGIAEVALHQGDGIEERRACEDGRPVP